MMKILIKIIITSLLFALFVPGVAFTIPAGNYTSTIVVHAVIYSIASILVWKTIKNF